jgi:hypothetical protein
MTWTVTFPFGLAFALCPGVGEELAEGLTVGEVVPAVAAGVTPKLVFAGKILVKAMMPRITSPTRMSPRIVDVATCGLSLQPQPPGEPPAAAGLP